jgi:hypothetical protein
MQQTTLSQAHRRFLTVYSRYPLLLFVPELLLGLLLTTCGDLFVVCDELLVAYGGLLFEYVDLRETYFDIGATQ